MPTFLSEQARARDSRAAVIRVAEHIRAQHDPADWSLLHPGPITYERASEILEWWHGTYIHGSSLDIHRPAAPKLGANHA